MWKRNLYDIFSKVEAYLEEMKPQTELLSIISMSVLDKLAESANRLVSPIVGYPETRFMFDHHVPS